VLIPHAIYLGTALPKDSRDTHLEGVATLLARVNGEGIALVATFTIRRRDHGKWYYTTVVLTEEKEKTRKFQIDGMTGKPVQDTPQAGLCFFERTPFQRVNPDSLRAPLTHRTHKPGTQTVRDYESLYF